MKILFFYLLVSLSLVSTAFSQEPPPAKVVLSPVQQEVIAQTQSVLGTLYFERESMVSAEVTGRVDSIAVEEGNHVKKGQKLVTLNTDLLEKDIALRIARIEQIDLRITFAEKNFKRLEKVYADQGVSEKAYDDALYSFQDSKVEKLAANEELAKLLIQKEKSVVKAPFSGIIMDKNVDTGDWVQQGKLLVRIASTDDLYVRVPVAETMLQYIKVGDKVPVEIVAYGNEIMGVVEDVSPTADAKTKNVFLKVKIPVQKHIAENMSAAVYVPAGPKSKLSIIPRAAVIKFQGKDFVYTVKDGKASILPVNIVSYLGDKVGVDNPYIAEGMNLVVEGNERLRPDQPVIVAGE